MSHINCKFKQLSEKHLPCSRYWEKKKEEKKHEHENRNCKFKKPMSCSCYWKVKKT